MDAKKKELIGNYANGGREWQPAGEPTRVNVHDFADRALGEFAKAIPYGVYDLGNDEGWVSVGDTADTAEFAVESIRRWWNQMGRAPLPRGLHPLDHCRCRRVQRPAGAGLQVPPGEARRRNGPAITVCHYPPGTSKWNKIEHRLFSFISINWRGRSLTDIRTIVELIAATKTKTGLTVQCDYDPNWYPTGVKISDRDYAAIPL